MKQFSPETLGILNEEVRRGVGAGTLASVLGPILDKKLEDLLTALDAAEPELTKLLDLRAKISTLRNLRKDLQRAMAVGREAGEKLNG